MGMTRAMRRLFLTYALSRFSFGSRSYNMPSRFLAELGYKDRDGDGFVDGEAGLGGVGSVGYQDRDGDGFTDEDFDPFPPDVPVWE